MMPLPRTLSSSALFPLSFVGVVLLIVAPVQQTSSAASPYKGWSGLFVSNDTVKQVYFYDQTVAVVELGSGKTLNNCELIEVTNTKEIDNTLKMLRAVSQPINITFEEMFQLMDQCDAIDSPLESSQQSRPASRIAETAILGIVPGTKWCGNSDIASTFFDLGKERDVDKCCRLHDLCPVKVQAYQTRYSLTNVNFFTKSHCACDDRLRRCLKNINTSLSNLMGNVYFNIIKVPCVEETDMICDEMGCRTRKFRTAQRFS